MSTSSAYVIIGANYGDEGKGLMTDYLVRKHAAGSVTRFNGGSQAGHTVVDRQHGRNVFNMFSSGTFAGATTRIARNALVYPHALRGEHAALLAKGVTPKKLIIDDRAKVTTPFDVWLNQEAERARGAARHGSCGLGINETVTRSQKIGPLTFETLMHWSESKLRDLVATIATKWVPGRCEQLNIAHPPMPSEVDEMLDAFMRSVQDLREIVYEAGGNDYENPARKHRFYGPAVYEGAQGLALDEDLGVFPHVTRSRTGLISMAYDLQTWAYRFPELEREVEVVYTTRTYLTRHGAGPLAHEMSASDVLCGGTVDDQTNLPNPWQGTLRFAPLHLPDLNRRVYADIGRVGALPFPLKPMHLRPCLALTCMDQASHVLIVERDNEAPKKVAVSELPKLLGKATGLQVKYMSYGPTAHDVRLPTLA